MSSCHRALQNCDVVHEIFSWLVPASRYDDMTPEEDAQRKRARHDLLSVALVCRVLAEHALDALWRELDDLLPVMLLLTESHESESEGLNASAALAGTQEPSHFAHLISDPEWARFRYYARRVRAIRSSGFGTFEASMLIHLSHRSGGKPLFPCLRTLSHTVASNLDIGLPPLVTSTLEDVNLTFTGEICYGADADESALARKVRDFAIHETLCTLSFKAPSLKRLTVTGLGRVSSLFPLLKCYQLRYLHMEDVVLTPRLLQNIVSMHHLRELNLNLQVTDCDLSGCSGLTGLQSLTLSGRMYQMPLVLSTIASNQLRTIRLADPSNRAGYMECVRAVHAASKFPSLRKLYLSADNSFAPSIGNPVQSAQLIELLSPLLCHRTLRTLSISRWQPGGFALSDSDMHTLAAAWPHIASLTLAVNRAEVVPTLQTLTTLARLCPSLLALELPSLTILSAAQLAPVPGLGPHPLRTLEVGDPTRRAEAFDAAQVARWLHRIFPRCSMPGECEDFSGFIAGLLGELKRLRHEAMAKDAFVSGAGSGEGVAASVRCELTPSLAPGPGTWQ